MVNDQHDSLLKMLAKSYRSAQNKSQADALFNKIAYELEQFMQYLCFRYPLSGHTVDEKRQIMLIALWDILQVYEENRGKTFKSLLSLVVKRRFIDIYKTTIARTKKVGYPVDIESVAHKIYYIDNCLMNAIENEEVAAQNKARSFRKAKPGTSRWKSLEWSDYKWFVREWNGEFDFKPVIRVSSHKCLKLAENFKRAITLMRTILNNQGEQINKSLEFVKIINTGK